MHRDLHTPTQASLGVVTSATGGGYYLLADVVPVQFSCSADNARTWPVSSGNIAVR